MRNTDRRSANDCATPSWSKMRSKMAISMHVCNEWYLSNCAAHRRSAVATTVSRMLRANTIKGADGTTVTAAQADPRRAWLVAKYELSPRIQNGIR